MYGFGPVIHIACSPAYYLALLFVLNSFILGSARGPHAGIELWGPHHSAFHSTKA